MSALFRPLSLHFQPHRMIQLTVSDRISSPASYHTPGTVTALPKDIQAGGAFTDPPHVVLHPFATRLNLVSIRIQKYTLTEACSSLSAVYSTCVLTCSLSHPEDMDGARDTESTYKICAWVGMIEMYVNTHQHARLGSLQCLK